MITRRALISTGIAGLLASVTARSALAGPASPDDPVAILNAIYTRAAKGKGLVKKGDQVVKCQRCKGTGLR